VSEESGWRARSKSLQDSGSIAEETADQNARQLYEFGPYRLDPAERKLFRGSEIVPLPPKAFDTLVLMVRNSGHLMEKDDLIRMLWPDSFVEEGSLSNNIFLLRKALGDDPAFIETVPRRGYRFVGAVRRFPDVVPARHDETQDDRPVHAVGLAVAPTASVHGLHSWNVRPVLISIFAVVFTVAVVVLWLSRQKHSPDDSSSHFKVFPLTGSIVAETDPAFSPDGKQIAYVGQDEKQSNFNVYVKLIGAGPPLRLTSNTEQERFPAWSPDGRYIAFLRNTQQGNDVYGRTVWHGRRHLRSRHARRYPGKERGATAYV
jgi:DNA-binding winged helix-turn-helix (wHTH) protein